MYVFSCRPRTRRPRGQDRARRPRRTAGKVASCHVLYFGIHLIALETVWNRIFSIFFTRASKLQHRSDPLPRSGRAGALLATSVVSRPVGRKSIRLVPVRNRNRHPSEPSVSGPDGLSSIALLKAIPLGFRPTFAPPAWSSGRSRLHQLLFGLSFPAALTYLTTSLHAMGTQTGRLAALTRGHFAGFADVTFVLYRTLGAFSLWRAGVLALANSSFLARARVCVVRGFSPRRRGRGGAGRPCAALNLKISICCCASSRNWFCKPPGTASWILQEGLPDS